MFYRPESAFLAEIEEGDVYCGIECPVTPRDLESEFEIELFRLFTGYRTEPLVVGLLDYQIARRIKAPRPEVYATPEFAQKIRCGRRLSFGYFRLLPALIWEGRVILESEDSTDLIFLGSFPAKTNSKVLAVGRPSRDGTGIFLRTQGKRRSPNRRHRDGIVLRP
jgi:hypothetical protein